MTRDISQEVRVIQYNTIGSNNLIRSRAFYDAVMHCIGGKLAYDFEGMTLGYLLENGQVVWVMQPQNGEAAVASNGSMPGFACGSREAVVAAHTAALATGGSCEGKPGPRPAYGPEFYGAYLRDPDGNKMSFVVTR